MEYLVAFQFWYCGLCVENQWGESIIESIIEKKSIAESIIEKKFSFADYVKITELHVLYTHDVTCNLSRWNNGGNDSYTQDQ